MPPQYFSLHRLHAFNHADGFFFIRTRRYDERPPPRYDERDRDRGYDDRYYDRGPPPPRYDDRGYDDRRGGDRYAERPPPRRYDDDGPRNPRGPSYTPGPKGPGGPGTDGPPPPPDVDGEPSNQWIFDKLVEREKARVKRDFGTADAIRDELLRLGVSARSSLTFCAPVASLSLTGCPSPRSVCVRGTQVEIWESKGERTWRCKDGRMGPRPNHEGKCF